jgi:transcriptional regulator
VARKSLDPDRTDFLQGTLDMLILRTLLFGPVHGQGIATSIEKTSDDVLQVDHGSLYPALQRLQAKGWITAKWGLSENNRKARYYSLTPVGKRQLTVENSRWERLTQAVSRIMRPLEDETS